RPVCRPGRIEDDPEPGVEQQSSLEPVRLHDGTEPWPVGDEARLLEGPGGGDARAVETLFGGSLERAGRRAVEAQGGRTRAGEAEHREQQREEGAPHQSTAPVQARLPMKIHSVALRSGMFELVRSSFTVPRIDQCVPSARSIQVVAKYRVSFR